MAAAVTAPAAGVRSRTAPAAFLRLGAFVPLALYGGLHWARLLDPAPGFAAFAKCRYASRFLDFRRLEEIVSFERIRSRTFKLAHDCANYLDAWLRQANQPIWA